MYSRILMVGRRTFCRDGGFRVRLPSVVRYADAVRERIVAPILNRIAGVSNNKTIMGTKAADRLVETICRAGIRRIYAVAGDSLNEVNDAVRRAGTVEWVHMRHEESGAFAASAEAQLNGIACCAGSSGPGHVHLVNGLYDAQRSNASVLAIASTCATDEFGTQYFQETEPLKLFGDCSGYCQMAATPAQLARMLPAALQYAVHRKEVAVVGLPGDVAAAEAAETPGAPWLLPSESLCRPADGQLRELARMIGEAEKITLFCGIGARGAHAEVVRLAGTIKAPVAYSFKSKMEIQYDNPYEIGMTGLLGLPSAYASMHESDLLILLGTDFPYEAFLPCQCRIVQVDIRPDRIGRRARVELGLAGDVGDTIRALLPMLGVRDDRGFLDRQLRRYREVREKMNAVAAKRGGEGRIAPEYAATLVDRIAADDAVFCVDTGMCCVWGARYLHATGRRRMLGSFNHGSMANALPMAIGAAFARPGQQIVALCGDGGLSMLLGDLATVVQYRLPVKIVVFNNRALGMVKLEMEVAGLPDSQTDLYNPDFAAVARAMGIPAFTADCPDDAERVLREAFATEGPVLVSVQTDPDALAMPPKVEFAQMAGFVRAMTKLILAGRGDEVIATARSNIKHLWGMI